MWEVLGVTMLVLIAIAKCWVFGHSVRQALTARAVNEAGPEPDGPDDGWRWWEEFDPDPSPAPDTRPGLLTR